MAATLPVSYYSHRGTVFYTPSHGLCAEPWLTPRLPNPPCRPRQRRPHSIHILRLPVGFVPFDLRPPPAPKPPKKPSRIRVEFRKLASSSTAKRVLSVLSPFSSIPPAVTPSTATASPTMSPTATRSAGASMDAAYHRRSTLSATTSEDSELSRMSLDSRGILATQSRKRALSATSTNSNTGLSEGEKPVCTSGGVSCYITLAEPTIFLTGLDHDGTTRDSPNSTQAIIRGKLQLKITKSVKIKAVTLKFTGKGRTEWPEGIPPEKTVNFEEQSLKNETIPFFNAAFPGSENGYGSVCTYTLRTSSNNSSVTNLATTTSSANSTFSLPMLGTRGLRSNSGQSTSKEAKRLSLQSNQSRSFQKGDSPFGPTPQQKGYKTFHPGVYDYPFELSVDNNSPETTNLPMASVKWMLECLVERSGTFKSNLVGTKEVRIVRSPSEDSLELVEPISISRKWENQLHYDIMISGKSFPLGSKIPIAFKLTPLAKVQVHKLKVYVSEIIEYRTSSGRVVRKDNSRDKILLLEKTAGKPLAEQYASSDLRVLAGGELPLESRLSAREMEQRMRMLNRDPTPLPEMTDNILGDIDLGAAHFHAATEIEMQVQLPTCEMMAKNRRLTMTHDCTWKNVQVHHWIKIVMRISKKDEENPEAKRRHFEISIDSPFTVLDCRATKENLALPEYSGHETISHTSQHVCGCPNAAITNVSPNSSSEEVPTMNTFNEGPEHAERFVPTPELARPPQAHLATNAAAGVIRPHEPPAPQRPLYMMRHPSYNPPAFDEDEPPPPMATPPPQYDHIIGTPSHDGLADYFARLGEEYDDDDDDDGLNRVVTNGRVNIANPRTPGGRIARSMDIDRNFMFNSSSFTRYNREASNVSAS